MTELCCLDMSGRTYYTAYSVGTVLPVGGVQVEIKTSFFKTQAELANLPNFPNYHAKLPNFPNSVKLKIP